MDTGETYIKMADCPEIYEAWQPRCGDWFMWYDDPTSPDDMVHGYYGEWRLGIIGRDDEEHLGLIKRGKQIWLPRQDQLQEMVKWTTPFYHMLIELSVFYRDTAGIGELSSWEQLWLAFVMKEKHGKVWTGTEWC